MHRQGDVSKSALVLTCKLQGAGGLTVLGRVEIAHRVVCNDGGKLLL